jgi:hypothetical protein
MRAWYRGGRRSAVRRRPRRLASTSGRRVGPHTPATGASPSRSTLDRIHSPGSAQNGKTGEGDGLARVGSRPRPRPRKRRVPISAPPEQTVRSCGSVSSSRIGHLDRPFSRSPDLPPGGPRRSRTPTARHRSRPADERPSLPPCERLPAHGVGQLDRSRRYRGQRRGRCRLHLLTLALDLTRGRFAGRGGSQLLQDQRELAYQILSSHLDRRLDPPRLALPASQHPMGFSHRGWDSLPAYALRHRPPRGRLPGATQGATRPDRTP